MGLAKLLLNFRGLAPWVPEVFFFRSEAATSRDFVILPREEKNPLDAAVTNLTSMRF